MSRLVKAAKTLYVRLPWLNVPAVRVALALAWTLFLTVLLVQSSGQPIIGPPAPPGPPDTPREIELTLGHVVTFAILVALWWWALRAVRPDPRALFVAVGFALIFGLMTELAQSAVPDREVSAYDLAANWLSALAVAWLIVRYWRGVQNLRSSPSA